MTYDTTSAPNWQDRLAGLELSLVARVALLVVGFVLVDMALLYGTRLTVADYQHPVILLRLPLHPFFWPTLVGGAVLIFILRGKLWTRWEDIPHGSVIRAFVMVMAALLAWPFSTYAYNHFVDQAHLVDRVLLLALMALTWYRPVFVFGFMALCYAIMFQLLAPSLGGPVIAHKLVMFQMLAAFGAYFLLRLFHPGFRTSDFLFLILCIMAGRYWWAGLAKVMIGWWSDGDVSLGFLGAWVHGWLIHMTEAEIVAFANIFQPVGKLLGIVVIVVELLALFLLAHRRFAIALLAGLICFHASVFVLLGFLFWTWMATDLALICLLIWMRRHPEVTVFTRPHLLISIPLIALSAYWSRPPVLGWFDTGLIYHTRITAIGESGARYSVPPRTFAPYNDAFTMNSFGYLNEKSDQLTSPYGITKNSDTLRAIRQARTLEDIERLERELPGRNIPDATRARNFYDFVGTHFTNFNASGPKLGPLAWIEPPYQFWSFDAARAFDGQEKVAAVEIKRVTYFYDGTELKKVREKMLNRIEIPSAGPGAS